MTDPLIVNSMKSADPPSSCLEIPPNRSSRLRKPVTHYGSFMGSDMISDAEEDEDVDDEDDDDLFEADGGRAESADEEAVFEDGSQEDTDVVGRDPSGCWVFTADRSRKRCRIGERTRSPTGKRGRRSEKRR